MKRSRARSNIRKLREAIIASGKVRLPRREDGNVKEKRSEGLSVELYPKVQVIMDDTVYRISLNCVNQLWLLTRVSTYQRMLIYRYSRLAASKIIFVLDYLPTAFGLVEDLPNI